MEKVTNEVLAERIDGIKHLLLNELLFIKEQTTKTNGRVTALEIKDNIQDGKINKFIGGLMVVDIVLAIAVAIALKIV